MALVATAKLAHASQNSSAAWPHCSQQLETGMIHWDHDQL
jgi:hypothetical protein